jgi:UPF0176 protein
MDKILLYYKLTPLTDPTAVRLWQKSLCERLGLRGRIIVSKHGLNGTVGGDIDALKAYIKETRSYPAFKGTEFKWSDGSREDFPRLSVKERKELVAIGAGDELVVDEKGVVGGGTHLSPRQVNELVEKHGDDVVFFDGRNADEALLGHFKGAVVPDVTTSHDFIAELDSGKYDHLKDKKVITYCTGGIRCEILTPLMRNRGFTDIFQLDGGIVRYGEQFGDDGLWEGALRVFDDRMTMNFSDHAKVLGRCFCCGEPTNNMRNCSSPACTTLSIICEPCAGEPDNLSYCEKCNT